MRVKEILKKKKMTAKELSAILGMTETGLGLAIGEKGNPPLKRLHEIADALEVPIEELFVAPSDGLTAMVEYRGRFYKAGTTDELRKIADEIDSMQ